VKTQAWIGELRRPLSPSPTVYRAPLPPRHVSAAKWRLCSPLDDDTSYCVHECSCAFALYFAAAYFYYVAGLCVCLASWLAGCFRPRLCVRACVRSRSSTLGGPYINLSLSVSGYNLWEVFSYVIRALRRRVGV